MTWLHPCLLGKWSLKVICPGRKSTVLVLDYMTGLFFKTCKGTIQFLGNFVFGHLLCFFVWKIITGIEIYLLQPYQLQKERLKKKKKLQKLGLTVMIFFHLILHPTVPIIHIYYSLFHLCSFVVVSVLQSFDAHGKEEKLSPGVYNLVRIKLWRQLFSTWIMLFTG